MNVKVFNSSKHKLPEYATVGAAGLDLTANLEKNVVLVPGKHYLIPTGIHIQLPEGYEAQVRGRSGLALKNGIVAHLGTIDSDYRGDIGVILFNNGESPYIVHDGDRIAQLVFNKYEKVEWEAVETADGLEATKRADGGYGHTGIK